MTWNPPPPRATYPCRHGNEWHCCWCEQCHRFLEERDWCSRCGAHQTGIGWDEVCVICYREMWEDGDVDAWRICWPQIGELVTVEGDNEWTGSLYTGLHGVIEKGPEGFLPEGWSWVRFDPGPPNFPPMVALRNDTLRPKE